MVIAAEKHRRIVDGGGAVCFGRAPLSSAAEVYPGAPWMVQNPFLLPDTPIPRHRDLGSCLDVDRCSLIIERSADHPTYATDPTGLYEGGSAFTQGTGSYGGGSGSSSPGSSAINLTPDQWNAASQIVNNATGSGSYGGVPVLQSQPAPAYNALDSYTVSNSALVNANTSYALSSEQANLDNAISQQATNEMVQTTNPLEGLAINAESQMATDNIDAAYANAQNQLDNADPSIAQMQDANQMQPTTIQSHWGDSAETVQGPIDRLASLPIVGTAINLGVQVGLPAGQRNYGQIALDAGSLGLLGLSAPVDTIGEALASGVSSASGTLTDATAAAQQYAGAFKQGFSNADVQLTMNSGVGGEFFQRLNSGIRAAAGVNSGELDSGFQNIVSAQFPNGEHQLAASKGFPGIGFTAEGVPDFAGSPYLYPVAEGQSNIVTIKLTGSRTADFEGANSAGGFSQTPAGYTWHHLGYDPVSGEGTLQLVQQGAHEATFPHVGGVSQYEAYNGVEYAR